MNPHIIDTALVIDPGLIIPLAGSSSLTTFLLIPLMIVAFYFLLIRPQRKRQKDQQRMLSLLEPGSRVLTHTGIFGTIVSIGDKQAVLEIAPGIQVTVLRQTLARAARPEDEDAPEATGTIPDETGYARGDETGFAQDERELAPAEPTPDQAGPAQTAAPLGRETHDTHETPADTIAAAQADEPDAGSGGIRDVTSSYFSRDAQAYADEDRDAGDRRADKDA